jgi:putative polyketide hydroxylase/tetracenomycin A2 monooxygenase-dioxygenase
VDQLSALQTPAKYWASSPTNFTHFPQNTFETILREQITTDYCDARFGEQVERVVVGAQGVQLHLQHGKSLLTDIVLAADGANSTVRRSLGIGFEGEEDLQTLVNIHFSCDLSEDHRLRPAMLYFVFNEKVVCVFVAHDIARK